jgi:serine/threonine-protein kinase
VHRDIKPANILISKEGEVKLIDFGIATTDDEEDDGLTKEGMTLGTPSYMAPEQIKDSKNVDKRADIYSMGVMLYEMVTGKTPYPGSFSPETITMIQRGKYKNPHKVNPRIVPVIRTIIRKCMYVNKNRRFKDVAAIFPYLHRYLKRREPDFLREAIKNYINNKHVKYIYKHAPSFLRFAAKAALLAIFAAGGLFYFFRQGLNYEYFMGNDYGAVQLTVRVNREYKAPQEIFVDGTLYKEGKDFPVELKDPDLHFTWRQEQDTKSYYVLQVPKFYLKSGHYRLRLNLEGRLYWQSFFVKPRLLQRVSKDAEVAMPLTVTYSPDIRQSFDIRPRIVDSVSGRDITAGTDLLILWGGRYQKLDADLVSRLTTGVTYSFQVARDKYYPQYYKFALKPYQDVAELNINLVPLPGYLVLSSLSNNLRVSLNNTDHYLTGGLERIYQPLQPLQKNKDQKLVLAPGEYALTIERSKTSSRTIRVTINTEATVTIKAEYEEKGKSFNLAVN